MTEVRCLTTIPSDDDDDTTTTKSRSVVAIALKTNNICALPYAQIHSHNHTRVYDEVFPHIRGVALRRGRISSSYHAKFNNQVQCKLRVFITEFLFHIKIIIAVKYANLKFGAR